MKKLITIINNEKCNIVNGKTFCQNIEMKTMPEALSKYFDVSLVLRKSNLNPVHQINLNNISLASNIFGFISKLIKEFRTEDRSYLIVAITPYTFISYFFLILFKKKIFLYLRSNGLDEYKFIFGPKFVWIYRIMLFLMSKKSTIMCVNDKIIKGSDYKLVLPSQLDDKWLQNTHEANLNEIKLLYVGRIKIEKGVYSLLKLFKEINLNKQSNLSLLGYGNEIKNLKENIKLLQPVSEADELIKIYDNHNITILPSFTEGHPQVLLESLARMRPVIIFDEINYVKKEYRGIFVCKRNSNSLKNTIDYIIKNYKEISKLMEKNILPSKKMFIKEIANILSS